MSNVSRAPLTTKDDPEKLQHQAQSQSQSQPNFQLQWQQWQNRQQRKAQERQVPQPQTLSSSLPNEAPFDDPYISTSTSSEDGDSSYHRNSVSSLASMASQLDVTYKLSQLSHTESESSYSSAESFSSESKERLSCRRTTVGKTSAHLHLETEDHLPNLAKDLGFDRPVQPALFNAKDLSSSTYDETSSTGEDLSSLSSALGGISIDFNFSTSLQGDDDSSSRSTSSDSYSDSSYYEESNGLSDLKGLAGDLSFDISTSHSETTESAEGEDSYDYEEGTQLVCYTFLFLQKECK